MCCPHCSKFEINYQNNLVKIDDFFLKTNVDLIII